MQPSSDHWFRNTVLYQIYPRSFFDSNGDGIGDLRGITQRLRYLNGDDDSLGIGAIWLSPFYPSPMNDFGYDITNHCDVDPIFGNLDDFAQLLTEAHRRGIKVFIDLIPNHTSDQHPWFKESKSGRDDPRRGWYTWRDPGLDGGPPNNWLSVFGGSAWTMDDSSGQYYLHSYLREQPDLNWENAGVREAIRQIMRFWLDLGVDGFRVDAVYSISKDVKLRDDPFNPAFVSGANPYEEHIHTNSKEGAKLYEYMELMTNVLRAYTDRFMVFEASPNLTNRSDSYLGLYEHVDPMVSAPFNFEGIHANWDPSEFREFIDRFQTNMHPTYVPVYCMGNHDQHRVASRIGVMQARASALMQLSLPGMPVIYYGDELGMTDGDIGPEDVKDTFEIQVPGQGLGRDPERTPMQWDGSQNAGFSKVKPWLPINPNYTRINANEESRDPRSSLKLYKQLIDLRQKHDALRYGSYQSLDISNDKIFCYERHVQNETMITIINFNDDEQIVEDEVLKGEILISSRDDSKIKKAAGSIRLLPYEAVILQVQP